MTGTVVGAGSVSLTVTALLLLGPSAVPRLIESIIFPAVLSYLALSVIYLSLIRLFGVLRLRSVANVLAVLAIFGLLAWYSTRMLPLVSEVSQAYLNGQDSFVWVTSVSWVSRQYGALSGIRCRESSGDDTCTPRVMAGPEPACTSFALPEHTGARHGCAACSAPMIGACYAAPRLRSPLRWRGPVCLPVLNPVLNPLWGFAVLSLGGLYQFAATQPLRVLVGAQSSPWQIYGRLLRAQFILLTLFVLPAIVILGVVDARSVALGPTALFGSVVGAILATCIGIFSRRRETIRFPCL